jgi:hypothetical protein
MTELDYLDHAEAALKAIEMACDRINDESDADVDNQRTGGMITLTSTTNSSKASGATPRMAASCLPGCRVMPASRPASPWCSVRRRAQAPSF